MILGVIAIHALSMFLYGQWMYRRGKRLGRALKMISSLNTKWGSK